MRPSFFVIGAGKCGTTTLCAMLSGHPDVFISTPKEPNFLSFDDEYARGWEWYESLFAGSKRAAVRGEGSVSYSLVEYEDRVCERMIAHLEDVRLIYIVREPLARIESTYRELHDSGHRRGRHLPFTISEAVEYRPQMVTNTMYWRRIGTYRRHFPDDRILVLYLEDLKADAQPVLCRCFEFLGVDPSKAPDDVGIYLNRGSAKRYDTKIMRFIRTNARLNRLWSRVPEKTKRILRPMLRRGFRGPLTWEPAVRQRILRELADDARQFLTFFGPPATGWTIAANSRDSMEPLDREER